MACRFYIFRFEARTVHGWNSYVHKDLYALAQAKKQRDLGKDVCDWYLQQELDPNSDGGDPVSEDWESMLNLPPLAVRIANVIPVLCPNYQVSLPAHHHGLPNYSAQLSVVMKLSCSHLYEVID
uniref:Uncharacterized protein n=1 Tax=Leersia perrieri TaxID=77586 RepID=A0A0D9WIZ7_9ORYZ